MANELTRLVLPKPLLRRLDSAGVYCQTWVTVERQARAERWILRAVESGGSSKEVGRYVAFFACDGTRLPWLQKLDRIGGNGAHAVVVGEILTSVEIARVDQTYQLLIVEHRLVSPADGKRPSPASTIVYRGIDGQLTPDLLKQGLTPEFFTRAGEVKPIPEHLVAAVRLVAEGASCVNCRHCHGLTERLPTAQSA
ncbi:MAG: hypothetical protein IT168_27100 [Bryobacterales bacterium]|nr:hypothetical protein [Bryobacterales bacterium]